MSKPVLNPAAAWRGLGLALLVWCAALLAGCGPGVGGTGTGAAEEAFAAFGASPAALCSSPLAGSLPCPGSTGTASPAGATTLWLTDSATASQVTAQVTGNDIEFDAVCERVRFSGTWGAVAGQPERFYGLARIGSTGTPVLAMLTLWPDAGGLSVVLQDSQGRVLSGPRLLRVQLTPPPAGSCN
ncbi:MAG: hypothetical protein Q8K96_09835 [Rubrivivax sp.]|nr:hypothetical protein [Rubrivivax sp.]